ncbi:MAG: hypothetical protein ACI8S6_000606 [Myxococcota bacterium]|jgi:hypothetical protein
MLCVLALLSLAIAEEPEPIHHVTIGPILATEVSPDPASLRLGPCLAALPSPQPAADNLDRDSALTVQIRIRRGRVQLVTVSDLRPDMAPMTPCLERELARVDWGIQRGDLEVPVTVHPPEAEEAQ